MSKRVIWVLFAVTVFAAASVPLMAEEVELPIQCKGEICVIPKKVLAELLIAHNEQVEEIRRLSENCGPKLKKERDA